MKKIILVLGGIIFVAILGRVIWAYQQVKNDEAKMADAPVLVVTTIPEPTVPPIANTSIISVATSTGPKETLLAMTSEFINLIKLLMPESAKSPQDLAVVFDSTNFKQFINKYVAANIVKKVGSISNENKGGFVFAIGMTLPEVNSLVKESITGNVATLSYDKGHSGTKTTQGVTSPTSWVTKCTCQMVLENNMWKVNTETASCQ